MSVLKAAPFALAFLAAACSEPPADQPVANDAAETVPPATAPAAPAFESKNEQLLTAEGWGPLRIGMTVAQVIAALGPDSDPEAVGGPDPEYCDQFRPERAPDGMLVMIEEGILSRISLLDDSKVKTDRGLGIGIPAAAVRAAYGTELQETPHKYEGPPAAYLTVWTKGGGPADRAVPPHSRGIQYVVDSSGRVGSIHAGGPSILYVEGCA
ncbi:MAG TPA: hypothetical protein VFO51_08620 [Sphingomicrobium sp.]|nr:hypothetical protein [Sphingomicrobium sp.]